MDCVDKKKAPLVIIKRNWSVSPHMYVRSFDSNFCQVLAGVIFSTLLYGLGAKVRFIPLEG